VLSKFTTTKSIKKKHQKNILQKSKNNGINRTSINNIFLKKNIKKKKRKN